MKPDYLGVQLRQIRQETEFVQKLLKSVIRDLTLYAYNPEQPRQPAGEPGGGRWTLVGNDEAELYPRISSRPNLFGRLAAASKRSLAYCEEQYKRDIFQCKMVGLNSCYAQALVRQIACQKGQMIPPLNY